MREAKGITLDVRPNTIRRAYKLCQPTTCHAEICPLALAGRKLFHKKNQKVHVNYAAQLHVELFDNDGLRIKTDVYSPANYKKAKNFITEFDTNKKVNASRFRYKLTQTF